MAVFPKNSKIPVDQQGAAGGEAGLGEAGCRGPAQEGSAWRARGQRGLQAEGVGLGCQREFHAVRWRTG